MSRFAPDPASLVDLCGQIVVLTGGANGIGASTIRALHTAGAVTIFGDQDTINGEKLAAELSTPEPKNVTFVKIDVTSYDDNLTLFQVAFQKHGRVDHAVSIAGIGETDTWFSPQDSIKDIQTPPSTRSLTVNLLGPCYFARIASAYLPTSDTISELQIPAAEESTRHRSALPALRVQSTYSFWLPRPFLDAPES